MAHDDNPHLNQRWASGSVFRVPWEICGTEKKIKSRGKWRSFRLPISASQCHAPYFVNTLENKRFMYALSVQLGISSALIFKFNHMITFKYHLNCSRTSKNGAKITEFLTRGTVV